MTRTVSLSDCRSRLLTLWFAGGMVIVLLLIVQSIGGHYLDRTAEAWAWCASFVLPIPGLLVGAIVAGAQREKRDTRRVSRLLYRVSLSLSAFYLGVVLLTLLAQPFALRAASTEPIAVLKLSGLWLGPLLGLVNAALAAVISKAKDDS